MLHGHCDRLQNFMTITFVIILNVFVISLSGINCRRLWYFGTPSGVNCGQFWESGTLSGVNCSQLTSCITSPHSTSCATNSLRIITYSSLTPALPSSSHLLFHPCSLTPPPSSLLPYPLSLTPSSLTPPPSYLTSPPSYLICLLSSLPTAPSLLL